MRRLRRAAQPRIVKPNVHISGSIYRDRGIEMVRIPGVIIDLYELPCFASIAGMSKLDINSSCTPSVGEYDGHIRFVLWIR